jgi:ABC-type Zn uptake system ZnuABC Zn-binding protein ZnuA
MIRAATTFAGLLFAVLLAACSGPQSTDTSVVFATILPQKDFVQQVAGARFEAHARGGVYRQAGFRHRGK